MEGYIWGVAYDNQWTDPPMDTWFSGLTYVYQLKLVLFLLAYAPLDAYMGFCECLLMTDIVDDWVMVIIELQHCSYWKYSPYVNIKITILWKKEIAHIIQDHEADGMLTYQQ